MNACTVRILIDAFAVNASIEAMKAENAVRASRGESPAYNGHSFELEAIELRNLSNHLSQVAAQGFAE